MTQQKVAIMMIIGAGAVGSSIGGRNMAKKFKVWSLKTADIKWSKYIRDRDKECQRCHRKDRQLQCSHYWDRQWYATRYDPENCICLCAFCHTFDKDNWEKDRNGEYEAYMMNKLGDRGFEALKKRHLKVVKRYDAIKSLMDFLKNEGGNSQMSKL